MQSETSLSGRRRIARFSHGLGVSALTLALFASQAGPAFAAIENTATPLGTPASGTLPTPPTSSVSVPVATANPLLTMVSVAVDAPNATTVQDGPDTDSIVAGGDTITYRYTIRNDGNVTINAVAPVNLGTTFNLTAGTGTFTGYTLISTTNVASTGAQLLPGESGTWTATYLLSAVDTYRAAGISAATGDALIHTARATGNPVSGSLPTVVSMTTETQIPSNPQFTIAKSSAFTTDTGTLLSADVGDVIRYKYVVTNSGNVTITNVRVDDTHESVALPNTPTRSVRQETIATIDGGSEGPLAPTLVSTDDGTANNGTWGTLRPGATIVFYYDHTVTQSEFDNHLLN
jgi:uncharacterized repeat protein (TIGR01451 family)